MPRLFLLLLLLTCVARGDEWQLHRHAGRDYVSLDNVADFYGLKPPLEEGVTPASSSRNRGLVNARAEIGLTIGSREVTINGVRQWFSFPVREEKGQPLISRIDLAKTIEPMLRPQLIDNLRPVKTIVLDPGHGGHDRGAVNALGDEKTYTLDVARRLKPMLEARGLKVVLTRDRDVFVPLDQRAKIANAIPDSIFVSIHFNSGGSHANGFEVFSLTPRGAPSTTDNVLRPRDFREEPGNPVDVPSAALAASVYHSMLGHFVDFDRGLKRARFAVIRLSTVPSILVEGGFISNKEDAASIHNPKWREYLAGAIAKGITGFKGLSELGEPSQLVADYRKGGYGISDGMGTWASTGGKGEGQDAASPASDEGKTVAPSENDPEAPASLKDAGKKRGKAKDSSDTEVEPIKDAKLQQFAKPLLFFAELTGYPRGVSLLIHAGLQPRETMEQARQAADAFLQFLKASPESHKCKPTVCHSA